MSTDPYSYFLHAAEVKHLKIMMNWFSSAGEVLEWAGPKVRYPLSIEGLTQDLNMLELSTYIMLSSTGELLAFGQYYRRLELCHLARLVVAPEHRSRGLVSILINKLSAIGLSDIGAKSCSLFVLKNNTSAIGVYQRLGFRVSDYPKKMPIENCLYMRN